METFGCNGVPGAGLDHEMTVPHPIGSTLVLTPWARRRTCEPDPAMMREVVKVVAWALYGTEAEQVVRPCRFRRFKHILMVRDPKDLGRRRVWEVDMEGHPESGWQRIVRERSR
jgi:hypothetical protein